MPATKSPKAPAPAAAGSLSARIEETKREFEKRVDTARQKIVAEVKDLESRYKKYEKLRTDLGASVVKPLLDELLTRFPETKVERAHDLDGGKTALTFPRSPERNALMQVTFALTHDGPFEKIFLDYELRIIPVFIDFEPASRFSAPLDAVDPAKLRAWLEDRLVAFAKTYYEMQFIEQYQKDNLVTDPVLNRRFPRNLAAGSVKRADAEYHFATIESKALFEKEPEKYLSRL